jgi:hypothetical protein
MTIVKKKKSSIPKLEIYAVIGDIQNNAMPA